MFTLPLPPLSVWPTPPFNVESGTISVQFAFEAVARSCVTRLPVIVGTGLQLPPAPGIPGGMPASSVDTEPASDPVLASEEPPFSPPLSVLPDELVMPDAPEGEPLPEDTEPLPEPEVSLPDEPLPEAAVLFPLEDKLPLVELPVLKPLPDRELLADEVFPELPVFEEPQAAPRTTPMAATSGAEVSVLRSMPMRIPRSDWGWDRYASIEVGCRFW
jgi:hypothetical protein